MPAESEAKPTRTLACRCSMAISRTNIMAARFQIAIGRPEFRHELVLNNDADFKLGDLDLDRMFQISLPKRERDMLRIFFGGQAGSCALE